MGGKLNSFISDCAFYYFQRVFNFASLFINEISVIRFLIISWYSLSSNKLLLAGLRTAVGNVSGYRCESDCRSRGRKFDPGPVPYFRGD